MDVPSSLPLALILALAPAAIRLWQDRRLLRFENDPTLPERLLARRKSSQAIAIICAILAGLIRHEAAYWTIPILIVANMAAGFPLRKRLFGETWSLGGYLWFAGRMLFGNLGFWILLGFTPALAGLGGTPPWLLPATTAAVLLAWHEWLPESVRALLRLRPITDPALLARFEDLARRSTAPMPRFDCLDLGGGVLINAFALASRRTASVVFTGTLLARLEPDEAVAICAHEIAHLEHYDRARLRRYALATRALIVFAGAITPLERLLAPPVRAFAWAVWPVALLSVLIWRAKDRQRNETASDQRAVALTGNAEALARALTKLHAWGRVPRRFSSEFERRATHPSLARRIRDIRAAAGTAAPVPTSVEAFASPDGATRVTFEPARLRWTEGETAEHALAYDGLTELRVHAAGTAAPRLVAVDRGGHKWQMPIADGDVFRVQAALDGVDGLLATARRPRVRTSAVRLSAVLAVALAFTAAQLAAAVTALAAVVSPSPALLAAAGVGSLAAASLALRSAGPFYWPLALTLAASGVWLCSLAYRTRRDEARPASMKLLAPLAAMAAIGLVLIVSGGTSAVRLYQNARALPSVAVLLLALATALAWERRRTTQALALAAIATAATIVGIGSVVFLDRFGDDPLLVRGDRAQVIEISGPPIAEYALGSPVSDLILSPLASAVLVSRYVGADAPIASVPSRYQVGKIGGTLRPVAGDAAAFADEDRLLAVRFADGGAELRLVAVDSPDHDLWRQHVEGMASGQLSVDDKERRWRLVGRAPDQSIVALEGQIGTSQVDTHRWHTDRRAWADKIATSGSSAIGMGKRYELGPLAGPEYLGIVPLLLGARSAATFLQLDAAAAPARESLLDTTCADSVLPDALVCAAYDGVQTRVAAVQAAGGRVVPAGVLDGRFTIFGAANGHGWLVGRGDRGVTAIRLATRDAFSIRRRRNGYVRALAASDTRLAAIMMDARGSRLSLFALPH